MNLLLDTHILIWALNEDPALPETARKLILDPDNAKVKQFFPMTVSTFFRQW